MIRNKHNRENQEGFTLVEMLLYIAIVSVVSLLLSSFIFLILQSRVRHQTLAIVDQEGIQMIQIISQSIRNADSINLPAQGSSGDTLSVEVSDAGKTPTVFSLSGDVIQIKEGVNANVDLNSSRVIASGLSFSNVSKTNTPGIIKFEFTLNYENISGRSEYEYSKTFYGSASLR